MRSGILIGIIVGLLCAPGGAESFNRRLARGQALLKVGDTQDAITVFRDLQVEDPESEILYYDLGCARYEQAMKESRAVALPEAVAALQEAIKSFDKASMTRDAGLRKDSQFNKATALAQIAKQSAAGPDPEATVAAFEQAITAFEDYLRQYPGDDDAQTNLNNVRYELKKYLQQAPPPEQQDQQPGKGEDGEKQDQDQQQQQNPQDGSEQQDQGKPPQQAQEGQDQNQPQDQEEQSQGEEQERQEQQMADAQPQDDQSDVSAQPEENRQNIEAILESLEDMDEQQQKEMRRHPRRLTIRSKWW